MGKRMIAEIRLYRPPLRVWRTRRHAGRLPIWVWDCRLCKWDGKRAYWKVALEDALYHLHRAHGCPSMRASGEPCDEFCADCGGKGWIK